MLSPFDSLVPLCFQCTTITAKAARTARMINATTATTTPMMRAVLSGTGGAGRRDTLHETHIRTYMI